jgi:hypothetical protein
MKIIYRAANIIEAHIVAGMLKANDIEAYVSGHYLQGGVGEVSASDFANVSVGSADIEEAEAFIVEYERSESSASETVEDFDYLDGYKPV